MRRSDEEMIVDVFRYHAPTPEQIPRYQAVRDAGRIFAEALLQQVPACADRTTAIRKVREAVMTANAAIALDGRV